MHESPKQETTFGYLSAVHSDDYGYFGGYLVVSALGRPLEFHCTAPVLPSRAQQILYGSTLGSFLLGEQIGCRLLTAAKLVPQLILTDEPDFGQVQRRAFAPLVLMAATEADREAATIATVEYGVPVTASNRAVWDSTAVRRAWCSPFAACNHVLRLPRSMESQRETVTELLALLAEGVELMEPFGRIREAICEAQRIGARGPDAHGQAA
jgi:hypothetical protein